MEFVDNTGHIFSLPSYNEKPIGYEYDEYSYVFWIDSNNTSKLSVNNFYSRPIYALYELNKNFDIKDLENNYNSALDIEIYIKDSNVFKLISSKELQQSISKDDFKLTDYVDLNMIDDSNNEKYNFLKLRLTNEDLYCIKTEEVLYANEQDTSGTTLNYLMIPIYPIAMAKEPGTWITNVMIHIHNNSNNTDEWCYISVGGEFIDEYEELVINGRNMGVSLPKDILKSVYAESLYNDEYNEALFNEKMKEYMLNYMNIKGNTGNFKSAIDSLKWFGYGDRISISKLLKTDNEFKQQYILDYFDISNDILESFKTFIATAFVSLMIHINKETDNLYPFTFKDDTGAWDDLSLASIDRDMSNKSFFYGENRPKMISLLDYYQKIKIGNHDMPIEEDDEKYWYWKPYFDFSFNELGVKLVCLSYYYKKYFLPIHLNVHSTSLGYRVFANNIKLTNTLHIIQNEPSVILNDKHEVNFKGNGIHYFTKQIHYIDEYFNEFDLRSIDIDDDNREWYYLNDTCVNIPIEFINNDNNKGYFNCILLLQKSSDHETLYESHFSFYQTNEYSYKNFIIYSKKINITTTENNVNTKYFEYWVNNDFGIKLLVNNKWYEYDFKLKIHNPTIDFGTLKYRYYFNDRNYLFSKIVDNTNNNVHNIILCDASDNNKIHNHLLDHNYYLLFKSANVFEDNISNMPIDYTCYLLDDTFINDEDNHYSYTINWDYENNGNECYIYYNFENDDIYDCRNATILDEQINYIDIDHKALLICPQYWGEPLFIKNDLKEINQYIYDIYDINQSWIQSFNFKEGDNIYQFFKDNYSLLSPFKQIRGLDEEHNKILFNSYMHNHQLVDMNEINFDVNIQTILKYHLDHNLLYIDGNLLDGEFYQFIIYKDNDGKKHDIFIHQDLLGKSITLMPEYVEDNDNIMLCAYNSQVCILTETFDTSNNTSNYMILSVEDNEDELLFKTETTEEVLLFDTIDLKYDELTNTYYEEGEDETIINRYEIYDRLYSNTDKIYSRYSTLVNLPNNLKYKNSLHLFGIYQKKISESNILVFHNNIDMYIDDLHFTHGKTIDINNDDQLKIYIQGNIHNNVDTRFPDTYGLYWNTPFPEGHKPIAPSEVLDIKNRLGFYVKRDARRHYEPYTSESYMEIWDVPNLYEYDTNEFCYYTERKEICIGNATFRTLDDFYNNKYGKYNLDEEYKDIKVYIKKINNNNIYCFDDDIVKDLDDLTKYYSNRLSYTIAFYNSNNEEIEVSLNQIDNEEYDHIIITFYYHKVHIVRNRFYILNDYLEYLTKNNISHDIVITNNDGKYYLNLEVDGGIYVIELIYFNDKHIYMDNEYNHLISIQNPSMYWYDGDKLSLQSLPSYLNEIERFVYKEDDPIEVIKENLDNYIYGCIGNRYANDETFARYHYKNYLIKDLTGISGKYRIEFITNIDDFATMHVEVIDKDNNIIDYTNNETILEFNGNENKITVFIAINDIVELFPKDAYIIPKLIKITETEYRVPYNAEYSTSLNEEIPNIIKTKYLNKEYCYGDNNNEFVYNLYNDFFKLKFNVYDSYFDNKELKNILLHSVYEYDEQLKLDTYLNYDFYLMHDDKYWYGLYISQETCDKIRTNEDLKLKEDDKKKSLNNKYFLNYEKTSQEYLINRLEFNTSEGFNQFKTDDIVCCYIHNNDRLPFNAALSSKWDIHPMSLGMTKDISFESNGEMTILSLPNNNSKYEQGYYKVTVKYSLDRDIQHQFKNTSTIRIS